MRSQDRGSLRDHFSNSEGPIGNSEDPFSSLKGPSHAQSGQLKCLEDQAMRSGGPGSPGSFSVPSVGPFDSFFSSEGESRPFRESQKNRGPSAPKRATPIQGALANRFAPLHSKILTAATA